MTCHSVEFGPIRHSRSPGFIPIANSPAASSSTCNGAAPLLVRRERPADRTRTHVAFKLPERDPSVLVHGHHGFPVRVLVGRFVDQIPDGHVPQRFGLRAFVVARLRSVKSRTFTGQYVPGENVRRLLMAPTNRKKPLAGTYTAVPFAPGFD